VSRYFLGSIASLNGAQFEQQLKNLQGLMMNVNTTTQKYAHPMAEGAGLSAEDTHRRYVDAFSGANSRDSATQKIERSAKHASGKAKLYALMVVMWVAIILVIAFAMVANGNACCSMWGWQ